MDQDFVVDKSALPQEEVKKLDKTTPQDLGEYEKYMKEFEVTDGKSRDEKSIEQIRKLEDLIGIADSNPFGTADAEVFEADLHEMTKTDLENLCIRVGIPPRRSVDGMKEALAVEFKAFSRKHGISMPTTPEHVIDPNSKEYKDLMKVLNN